MFKEIEDKVISIRQDGEDSYVIVLKPEYAVDGMTVLKLDAKGAKGGKGGKLSGGRWVTMNGTPVYIKGGKFVTGPLSGKVHTPKGGGASGGSGWSKVSDDRMELKSSKNGVAMQVTKIGTAGYMLSGKVEISKDKTAHLFSRDYKTKKQAMNAADKIVSAAETAKNPEEALKVANSIQKRQGYGTKMQGIRKSLEENPHLPEQEKKRRLGLSEKYAGEYYKMNVSKAGEGKFGVKAKPMSQSEAKDLQKNAEAGLNSKNQGWKQTGENISALDNMPAGTVVTIKDNVVGSASYIKNKSGDWTTVGKPTGSRERLNTRGIADVGQMKATLVDIAIEEGFDDDFEPEVSYKVRVPYKKNKK